MIFYPPFPSIRSSTISLRLPAGTGRPSLVRPSPKMGFVPLRSFFFLLSLLLSFCRLKTVRGNAELEALMEVKAALDPEGRFLSSWVVGEAPCSGAFVGVGCNERGQVANISLQGKGLSGSISPAVARLISLTGLYLHYNAISGSIPKEILNLTQLSDLYLNVNNLSGNIPVEIGGMANLQVLQLGFNQLSGSIPTQLGLSKKLRVLSLQYNHLNGAIPASLGDLAQLSWLDLSFNQLFGSIPVKLSQASQLYVLDLQNNSLSGSVPLELKRLKEGFKYRNNRDLCGAGFPSLRLCTAADIPDLNRTEPYGAFSAGFTPQYIPLSANINSECNGSPCSTSSRFPINSALIGVIVILVTVTILGFLAFTWYLKRRQIKNSGLLQGFELKKVNQCHPNELYRRRASPLASLEYSNGWDPLSVGRYDVGFSKGVSQNFKFNLEEVECATQYFSEANLIRKSNFSATYRGVLRDGTMVAVKSISKTSCKSEEGEFLKGLKILAKLQHENLVRLRGFCCSRARGECFLIYDFISNGKLSQYLHAKSQDNGCFLDWPSRVAIIKGIAKGIEYLHSNRSNKPSVIHQNISADKILLDHTFNPFLTGCGLHKLLADDVIFSTLKANAAMGYLAPEYATIGRLTEKSDVYALGIIMLQILTGKERVSHLKFEEEGVCLKDLIDENLIGNFSKPEASNLAEVALLCASEVPSQRPTMETVLKELSFAVG